MTIPQVNASIAKLPMEIWAHIASYVGDPAVFAVCSKFFNQASSLSFPSILNNYRQLPQLAKLVNRFNRNAPNLASSQEIAKWTVINIRRYLIDTASSSAEGSQKWLEINREMPSPLCASGLEQAAIVAEEIKAKELIHFFTHFPRKDLEFPEEFDRVVFQREGLLQKAEKLRTFLVAPENKKLIAGIKYLNLSSCKMRSVPPEIANFPKVNRLFLERNSLKDLPKEVGYFKELDELSLSYNELSSLPDELYELKQLRYLRLARNRLESLSEMIGKLQNLTSLDLSRNQLKNIPKEIGLLKKLKYLDISNNDLDSIPQEIGSLTNLESLNLVGNRLLVVPDFLSSMPRLKEIRFFV